MRESSDFSTRNGTANKELGELINLRNIINYVKAQRLSWFGHKIECLELVL